MKILLCSIYLPSGHDGVSNSTRQLVAALKEKGVDITVVTTDWGWSKAEKTKKQAPGLKVFKALGGNNFDFSFEMLGYIHSVCKEYDLIHFNSIYSLATVMGGYFSRKTRIPYIVCPQGNFVPVNIGNYHGVRSIVRKKIFFRLLSKKAMIEADRVVCNSQREAGMIGRLIGTNNVVCINNGINSSLFSRRVDRKIIEDRLGITPDKTIFLFLGRLAEEKAIPFLLDVWESLIKKQSNSMLVLAGQSEHGSHKKIQEGIRRFKETILLPGVVTGDLKTALLQESRCLLLPSYFESFGNVVLESLASGTPVIASTGTQWEVLKKKAFGKWLPWNVEAWTNAMLDISTNDKYQSDLFSRQSRQWVSDNFNWDNLSNDYIRLYRAIKPA